MEDYDYFRTELRRTLANLAASADTQERYLTELGVGKLADELALEFEAVATRIGQAVRADRMSLDTAMACHALNGILDAMSGEANRHLWSFAGLESPEWGIVRNYAGVTLQFYDAELRRRGEGQPLTSEPAAERTHTAGGQSTRDLTSAPGTTAPGTTAPEASAPETSAPGTPAPDIEVMARDVDSKASFLAFLHALAADRADEARKEAISPSSPYGPGHNGWENTRLEDYLEAAAAWMEDNSPIAGEPMVADAPSWRAFALILMGGKYYE